MSETTVQPESAPEPRNYWYIGVQLMMVVFSVTALAYAVLPSVERWSADAGQPWAASPIRDSLRRDGWMWLLAQVGVLVVLSIAAMVVDRWRQGKLKG